MHVLLHTCMHASVFVHACVCSCMYMYAHVCMCVCAHAHACTHVYILFKEGRTKSIATEFYRSPQLRD